jgi:hypothetical protein
VGVSVSSKVSGEVGLSFTVDSGVSTKSLWKQVKVNAGQSEKVLFYVKVVDHGEYKLTVKAFLGSTQVEIQKSVKTYIETEKITKLADLRKKRFFCFYFSNFDNNVFETSIKIQGDLMGEKLKNVDKFM